MRYSNAQGDSNLPVTPGRNKTTVSGPPKGYLSWPTHQPPLESLYPRQGVTGRTSLFRGPASPQVCASATLGGWRVITTLLVTSRGPIH